MERNDLLLQNFASGEAEFCRTMETAPGCCAGRPRSRRRVWLAHDQRFLFELPQGLLLFQQFNPIRVRRVRLVHALNELGELTVNGLVPQALRDVRELLTAVRN